MNWESCKVDIRQNLIEYFSVDKIIITLIAVIVLIGNKGIFLTALYYLIILVASLIITILVIILIHLFFPDKRK